jgi:hypothetical protein
VERIHWDQLPHQVRAEITRRTGPVRSARTASAGKNSAIAAILDTRHGSVFVKGLPAERPGHVREAEVNPYVREVAAPLLWHTVVAGWRLLGFAHTAGRHANYTPGSGDLPRVVATMRHLGQLPCPDLPALKRAEQRWASHVEHGPDLVLLRGKTLLHTDYAPDNVLVNGGAAKLIDWAWPTRGAGFIDPACLVVRLIHAGHTPAQAEAIVSPLPVWSCANREAINAFAAALVSMWTEIAAADPDAVWKQRMASAAQGWRKHRTH